MVAFPVNYCGPPHNTLLTCWATYWAHVLLPNILGGDKESYEFPCTQILTAVIYWTCFQTPSLGRNANCPKFQKQKRPVTRTLEQLLSPPIRNRCEHYTSRQMASHWQDISVSLWKTILSIRSIATRCNGLETGTCLTERGGGRWDVFHGWDASHS